MWQPLHGLLLVDKPAGISSAGVVGKIKWQFKQLGAPKNVKIGHGGTLDPFATGLLPIGVGHGTKALEALLKGDKGYQFTLQFGTATTTQDLLGEITATNRVVPIFEQIEAVIPRFTGPQWQTPPAFSALKVGGKRAYALARAGEAVHLEPRQIEVYKLKLLSFQHNQAQFEAIVSKGTYIRTLGANLAEALGTLGHLTALRRTQHGAFALNQAIGLPQLLEMLDSSLKNSQTPPCLLPLPAPAGETPGQI
jgi:tRNA pseudouridine55 synthase